MRNLHLGPGITWPATIASRATALLGVRGSGKSNLARVMAEEANASKIPVVIFDPIGSWFGIRSGADGKPQGGLPFAIFGGHHGDLQLEAGSGHLIADTVVDNRLSCVLDMGHEDFSEADKRRFLTAFGERLFRKKQPETGWMLLIFEEVDDYAPQSPRGEQARTLQVFQQLVKRGRFKGLGAVLVTQRSAAVSKDLLYMAETLVAFRTTAPRDQDTVVEWMKRHALATEAADSLAELKNGEAWVWSPEVMSLLARQKFRPMSTLDTGRTPEHVVGKEVRPATLADIDVPALRDQMQQQAEQRKQDDPRELRKTIAELRAELKKAQGAKPVTPASAKTTVREIPILKDRDTRRLDSAVVRLNAIAARLEESAKKAQDAAACAAAQAREIKAAIAAATQTSSGTPAVVGGAHAAGRGKPMVAPANETVRGTPGGGRGTPAIPPPVRPGNGDGRLTSPEQRILDALAWLDSIAPGEHEQTAVAFLAGYTVGGGAFNNPRGRLRSLGLIEYRGGEVVARPVLFLEGRA